MVSKIKFKFKGKKYILEYTRHSATRYVCRCVPGKPSRSFSGCC